MIIMSTHYLPIIYDNGEYKFAAITLNKGRMTENKMFYIEDIFRYMLEDEDIELGVLHIVVKIDKENNIVNIKNSVVDFSLSCEDYRYASGLYDEEEEKCYPLINLYDIDYGKGIRSPKPIISYKE